MDTVNIKYRYALEDNGSIVDVTSLTSNDRKDYECVSCGNIVRPVLPETERKNHFRHKVKVECSFETYLHRMGKIIFEKTYKECLKNNEPYIIDYEIPICCNYCEHGPCEISRIIEKYDLTKSFKEIQIEKKDGDLIPDLMLIANSGNKIYIEIAVTHKSTVEKINSDIKIIEFELESEDDLLFLDNKYASILDYYVNFYNFSPVPILRNLKTKCTKIVEVFIVYPNGKSAINNIKIFEFDEYKKNTKLLYINRIDYSCGTTFVEEVENAYYNGVAVKNCFLCRYHAIARWFNNQDNDDPIFCKYYKKTTKSNYAADCEIYRPDPKVFENRRT